MNVDFKLIENMDKALIDLCKDDTAGDLQYSMTYTFENFIDSFNKFKKSKGYNKIFSFDDYFD